MLPTYPWLGYGFGWGLRCATHTRTLALPQLLPMQVGLPVTISTLNEMEMNDLIVVQIRKLSQGVVLP